MMSQVDKETSVHEIFQKLKAIFGTPKKVCAKVIRDHFRIGTIPETGMGLIFQVLSQHQDLLNKTNTYLKSFKEKDIEEATITLRHHAYDLYTMLPQSIIIQANKFLIQNREPEWDVTEATTSKQFYEFFKTAIKVVMRKLPKNVQKMV